MIARHSLFYGLAAFGFRPRLDVVTARSSWRLTASRKSGEPRGRPINSFRRNALNSESSWSASGRSAKLATRSRKGWTLTPLCWGFSIPFGGLHPLSVWTTPRPPPPDRYGSRGL